MRITGPLLLALLLIPSLTLECPGQLGRFARYADLQYRVSVSPVVVADLNSDRYPDVFEAINTHGPNCVTGGLGWWGPGIAFGQGDGSFVRSCVPRPPAFTGFYHPSFFRAVGDVDNDGDLDFVLGQGMQSAFGQRPKMLFRNDSTGQFSWDSSAFVSTESGESFGVLLADLDRDGDLDLVSWNSGQPNQIFFNNGTGRFTEASSSFMPNLGGDMFHMVAFDKDGDGDLDLAASGYAGAQNHILENDGTGRFFVAQSWPFSSGIRFVPLDADGDGDQDLFLANDQTWAQLFINIGAGTFVDASTQITPRVAGIAAAGDIDGDGDTDLVGPGSSLHPGFLLNNGQGFFTEVTQQVLEPGSAIGFPVSIQLVDIDLDGDLDVHVVFNSVQFTSTVLLNHWRQFRGSGLAQRTLPYALQIFGQQNHRFFTFVGLRMPVVVIPGLGYWALDPAALIPLPVVVLPPSGSQALNIPIPDNAGLVGHTFWFQGIDSHPTAPVFATVGLSRMLIAQ